MRVGLLVLVSSGRAILWAGLAPLDEGGVPASGTVVLDTKTQGGCSISRAASSARFWSRKAAWSRPAIC